MNLMKTFLLTFSLFLAAALPASAECRLAAQEWKMEQFKATQDQYNERFYDDPSKILEVLDTIVKVGNKDSLEAGLVTEQQLEEVYAEHRKMLPFFGKMYIYVNGNQMMLWVEDKEGCYMGHGKHKITLWLQVKDLLEGV